MSSSKATLKHAAIRLLEPYYEQYKDSNAGLFVGVSYQLTDQASEAIHILEDVVENLPPPADQAARWHLPLAYLQNDDAKRALLTLQQLPDDGIFGVQKQQLMSELEQVL